MKKRAVLLIFGLIIIYLVLNVPFIFGGRVTLPRLVTPLLWLSLALLVRSFPQPRVAGRLRLQGLLRLLALLSGGFYLIAMAAGGFIDGFGKSPYDLSLLGILLNFIFIASSILGMESARAYLLNGLTTRKFHLLIILISLVFLLPDLTVSKLSSLKTLQQVVTFAGTTLMPGISENVFLSYLAYLGGPVPVMIYKAVVQGFHWFSPILPNLGWVLQTLLGSIVPFACLILVQYLYQDVAGELKRSPFKKESYWEWLAVSVFSVIIIWFAAGLFPIYPAVIATGSMEPLIQPGDVTILKKVENEGLKPGDIIHFRKDNYFITHRVVEVLDSQNKSYRTKGDNNQAADTEPVAQQQIKGKLLCVIPRAGWPSLWLRAQGLPQTGSGEDT